LKRGRFFLPRAVYLTDDGGEWLVRDYAGQSGRFCVIGPWTVDVVSSHRSLEKAKAAVEEHGSPGAWVAAYEICAS
jgi:hypothetical protein